MAKPLTVRAFVARLSLAGDEADTSSLRDFGPDDDPSQWIAWSQGALHVWVRPRYAVPLEFLLEPDWMVLAGDASEWDDADPDAALVGAATVRHEASTNALTIRTSIVGLPPVFLYRDAQQLLIASDLYLLAGMPEVRLELDPVAVRQLGDIGHPVNHRTLYKQTTMLPGASAVRLLADGTTSTASAWRVPPPEQVSWEKFTETQIAAFEGAVGRLDVSGSFLSLTAGLDTRAVFATLVAQGRLVPSVTMTGTHPSLDARTASRLCRAYGARHEFVTFDDRFTANLPRFVEQASLLSGGLSSLGQAPEVYFYDQLRREFTARVSGNLGNQVGRGGTEGIGLRRAAVDVIAPSLRTLAEADGSGHWLLGKLDADDTTVLGVILGEEIPFSSVGNFAVGHHFAVQQSPYANRRLVETLRLKPAKARSAPSGSLVKMRIRDLRHRFLGEPLETSFQRQLLQRRGGFAARYPINLGWRASGGVSPGGLVMGAATLLGMVAQKTGFDEGTVGGLIARTGIPALHNFRHAARWLRRHLQEFTRDTLSARSIHDSGLFEPGPLQRLLDEHFSGARDHYETVTFALDAALAHRLFCSASDRVSRR